MKSVAGGEAPVLVIMFTFFHLHLRFILSNSASLIFYHKLILLSTSNLTSYLTGGKEGGIFLINFMKEHFAIILSFPVVNRSLSPRYSGERQKHALIRRLIFSGQKKAYFPFPTDF